MKRSGSEVQIPKTYSYGQDLLNWLKPLRLNVSSSRTDGGNADQPIPAYRRANGSAPAALPEE